MMMKYSFRCALVCLWCTLASSFVPYSTTTKTRTTRGSVVKYTKTNRQPPLIPSSPNIVRSSNSVSSSAVFYKEDKASEESSSSSSSSPSFVQTSNPKPVSYLRWYKMMSENNNDDTNWKMQTAVTTFQKGNVTLELHAQLHFGTKDYFEYFNTPEFLNSVDVVHYELLVDEDLLEDIEDEDEADRQETAPLRHRRRRLQKPIMASPNDQYLARQYQWSCQASIIDYTHPKWIHADLSRQEFVQFASAANPQKQNQNQQQPLWQLASSTSAATEAVSALLVGPPTLLSSSSYSTVVPLPSMMKRRLFTNLFLPGSNLANTLRAMLWMTIPCPELSILLLDWSSIIMTMNNNNNVNNNFNSLYGNGNTKTPGNALSEVALPILKSIIRLDILQLRRFLFGQVLVSSNNNNDPGITSNNNNNKHPGWSLIVTRRNDLALSILQNTLEQVGSAEGNKRIRMALLYGSSHCPDLHSKLMQMGFTPVQTTWRTAWSVSEDDTKNHPQHKDKDSNNEDEDKMVVSALTFGFIAYLVIGALDWVGMMGDVSQAAVVDGNYIDASLVGGLYLLRHVLLYLGWSKFLVDWTNNNNSSSYD